MKENKTSILGIFLALFSIIFLFIFFQGVTFEKNSIATLSAIVIFLIIFIFSARTVYRLFKETDRKIIPKLVDSDSVGVSISRPVPGSKIVRKGHVVGGILIIWFSGFFAFKWTMSSIGGGGNSDAYLIISTLIASVGISMTTFGYGNWPSSDKKMSQRISGVATLYSFSLFAGLCTVGVMMILFPLTFFIFPVILYKI